MCTIFTPQAQSALLGKNYDSFIRTGMIFTNRRSLKKRSLVMPGQKAFFWTSEFGSVTFSQSGKGMPVGGINENGLVVEQASLPGALYPEADERAEISCLEATQFLLDTCGGVESALRAFDNFRISRASWPVHFFLFDQDGKRAIVEFMNGQPRIYRGNSMPVPVLTNSSYPLLCTNGEAPGDSDAYRKNSLDRFRFVSNALSDRPVLTAGDMLSLLKGAERPDTVWSCVYDTADGVIRFRTFHCPSVKRIALSDLDFSWTSELYDLDTADSNFHFSPYSRAENRKNIAGFFGNADILRMMHLPDADFVAQAFDDHAEQTESGTLPES